MYLARPEGDAKNIFKSYIWKAEEDTKGSKVKVRN